MSTTQCDRILALLRDRGDRGITWIDAFKIVGSSRLAARIQDLEAKGYEITSTPETTDNGARIARYRIVEARAVEQLGWLA